MLSTTTLGAQDCVYLHRILLAARNHPDCNLDHTVHEVAEGVGLHIRLVAAGGGTAGPGIRRSGCCSCPDRRMSPGGTDTTGEMEAGRGLDCRTDRARC